MKRLGGICVLSMLVFSSLAKCNTIRIPEVGATGYYCCDWHEYWASMNNYVGEGYWDFIEIAVVDGYEEPHQGAAIPTAAHDQRCNSQVNGTATVTLGASTSLTHTQVHNWEVNGSLSAEYKWSKNLTLSMGLGGSHSGGASEAYCCGDSMTVSGSVAWVVSAGNYSMPRAQYATDVRSISVAYTRHCKMHFLYYPSDITYVTDTDSDSGTYKESTLMGDAYEDVLSSRCKAVIGCDQCTGTGCNGGSCPNPNCPHYGS